MADDDGQTKKHAPGERQWKDAAERGSLPRSADVSAVVGLMIGGSALVFAAPMVWEPIARMWREVWIDIVATDLTSGEAVALLGQALTAALLAIAVPLLAVGVGLIGVQLAQTGGKLAPKAMEPSLDKINPWEGFKQKYLSWTPLMELGKGVGKMAAVVGIAAYAVGDRVGELPRLAVVDPRAQLYELADLAWAILAWSIPVIAVIAAADYAYAYWRQYTKMKRTDQQVREEDKEREGDPHMKARRKARARQIAMANMLVAVREADVLVVNPTHYAVALRYRRETDRAPMVVAKGVDDFAQRLKAEAFACGIPRIENRPLARALYAEVKVGHPVPEALYGAVAKVLAAVYRMRSRRA